MNDVLHLLHLEDNDDDARLIQRVLEQGGYEVKLTRVDTREQFLEHLTPDVDVILADHALPTFNSIHALDLVQARGLDIPFIIVSGMITEEAAVESLRHGAADFILKDRMARLGPAVARALSEKKLRREKQQAQRQHDASRRLLERFATHTLDAIATFRAVRDADARIVDFTWQLANPRCSLLMKRPAEQLPGASMREDTPGPLTTSLFEQFVQVMERGTPYDTEVEVRDVSEQSHRWVHVSAVHLDDGIAVTYRDITARKNDEARLQESEARYRMLAENVSDVIVRQAPDGTCLYVSPGIKALAGYAPEERVGQNGFSLVHPDDLSRCLRAYEAVQRGEVRQIDYRLRRSDGSYVWAETTAQAVVDSQTGRVREILSVTRDVTRRKEYEEGLIQAREYAEEMNRLKSAFLSNMSHELRTPLTGIIGFADLLAEELTDDKRSFVRIIQESGQQLLETLKTIMDLAQIEGGAFQLAPEMIDVGERLVATIDRLRDRAHAKGLQLILTPPEAPVHARLDPGVLDTIVTHLLSNAIKFTNTGRITVTLAAEDDHTVIEVADTGVGISPSFLPHIFDTFRQESSGEDRIYGGTGLGLTVVKHLVDLMGGIIEVTSEPDHGSTFRLRLPREDKGYEQLTQREREILHLVARGLTSSAIAERLFISERTVEKHRSNIMNKLQLDNPFGLLRYALRQRSFG